MGELSEEEKEMIREQIKRHRELEPLISEGDFYRLKSPFRGNLCAWQLVSGDKTKSYVFVAFRTTGPNPKGEYLRLQGLDPKMKYLVKQLDTTVSGDTLMNAGLPVRMPQKDYAVLAFDLENC